MSQIRILPEILSNKIAAGEVVERPASVVKELVENALDAGSSRIMIEIEKGGRSMIRVSDDGGGMVHDDALLALERYATSKIASDDDLFSIGTLGFRGEALPSIAAVSRMTLVSRAAGAVSGTEIQIEGGRIQNVSEVGAPPGTMVAVRQLFFNTPARRKFLKTVTTEMGHIADVIASLALGHPQVHFKLLHNRNIIKQWPAVTDGYDRAVDVLGRNVGSHLHALDHEKPDLQLSGWIATPRVTRSTSRGIYLFVNGRWVRDKVILHAIFDGYTQRLVKGQYPLAVLFIQVPVDQVDVNVHPTKHEIRFTRQRYVHDSIRDAIAGTLDQVDRPAWAPQTYDRVPVSDSLPKVSESIETSFKGGRDTRSRIQELGYKAQDTGSKIQDAGYRQQDSVTGRKYQISNIKFQPGQSAIWETRKFSSLRVIGQLRNTYVICESDDGLMLIDQHAAHERIYYEQLKRQAEKKTGAVQNLLVPETVEVGFRGAEVLEKRIPELSALGLEIEPFGGNSFVIKAVPAMLAGQDVKPLVIEIAEKLATTGYSDDLEAALDAAIHLIACHGAIRASQSLAEQQMEKLLEQLDGCENPSHCPHGRPTWVQLSLYEMEKLFKRNL